MQHLWRRSLLHVLRKWCDTFLGVVVLVVQIYAIANVSNTLQLSSVCATSGTVTPIAPVTSSLRSTCIVVPGAWSSDQVAASLTVVVRMLSRPALPVQHEHPVCGVAVI